ncbi:hypothetical protein DVH05_025549 [Phytophthora capsici]|nr:hypothetical protein DVH05_025549 [Phytophthora capsici]
MAGSAELGSEHPLSNAIVEYTKSLTPNLEQPTEFRAVSGRGISCIVQEHMIILGNRQWMVDNNLKPLDVEVEQTTNVFESAGKTPSKPAAIVHVTNDLNIFLKLHVTLTTSYATWCKWKVARMSLHVIR